MDTSVIADAVRQLLFALGEDPDREELARTPLRSAEAWRELLAGRDQDPLVALSPVFAEESFPGEAVSVRGIAFRSICEHHLLPFDGDVNVMYRSSGPVAGLGSLVRVVDVLSSRLQLQERLTQSIADVIFSGMSADGVVVTVTARHGCVSDRGSRQSTARATTVASRGCYSGAGESSALTLLFDGEPGSGISHVPTVILKEGMNR